MTSSARVHWTAAPSVRLLPPRVAVVGTRPRSVDVLDNEVDVSAGQDKQSDGIDRLRAAHTWMRQVVAQD